jgi:small subunit ribosomal protein S1
MALASRRIKQFEIDPAELDRMVQASLGAIAADDLDHALTSSVKDIQSGSIVQATVDSVDDRTGLVVMDIGGKSEGSIAVAEFGETLPKPGDVFEVYYEGLDEHDTALISKRRADRLRAWERVSTKYKEGDEIQGVVQRKIKGGLLVDVEGVNVFLPASQVNLRRTHDISDFINEPIRARIIKIDQERMNIVISRRMLLEEERQKQKEVLLENIQEGQVRKGVIKNIADFGVFVDLGGIDGLLHITDMTWGRINHPSEMVQIDQEIEVKVLRVDTDRERIALGLKQKSASPWEGIEAKYPVGSKHLGEVVNIMSYGAFVKLQDGVEGLVHISEMSWTRRINHPSELVKSGDHVEVVVLEINKEKSEISLGMKQAETNPWDLVDQHYPVGTVIEGTVRNLTSYGAFVEIEEGIDGLLHVSDMSWTKKISHPSEMVKKGDKLRCVVLSVDTQKKRIALGYKQLTSDPWMDHVPNNFHVGDLLSGVVTKLTNFGAFVRLEDDLEGLLHISELADHKVNDPSEIVQPGIKVEVRVIRVDTEERKIGLSFVHSDFEENKAVLEAAARAPKPAPVSDEGAAG